VLDTIPVEPYSEVRIRKAAKYLEYAVLESIPTKIRALRETVRKIEAKNISKLAVGELLIRFLLVLAWRQRNLRECRIAGPTPNLFKGRIGAFSQIDKPKWVVEAENRDPNAEFWQFRFSCEETKMGIPVHAVLPRPLIAPLEEYLNKFRPQLIGSVEPLTLFVNSDGMPMGENDVTRLVSELTLRHGGRVVTPHLFRDVVAFAWLKAHAADYLTLSKLLWHSSVNTTIFYYGGRFNESSGVCAMESWLEERAGGTKFK
jgi:integrase